MDDTLEVCVVCAHLAANGEYSDGTDAAERCAAGQTATLGADARYLVVECGDPVVELSRRDCMGCGDETHGRRWLAWVCRPL